jgi:hypothetical protein
MFQPFTQYASSCKASIPIQLNQLAKPMKPQTYLSTQAYLSYSTLIVEQHEAK